MIATAVEETVASISGPRKTIDFAPFPPGIDVPTQDFKSLQAALDSSMGSDLCYFDAAVSSRTKESTVVVLSTGISTLSDLTTDQFDNLKALTLSASKVLWVSRGVAIDTPNPWAALCIGLLRTLRLEYGHNRYVSLDLDPAQDIWHADSVKAICAVLRLMEADRICEYEFAVRKGEVLVPRLRRYAMQNKVEARMASGESGLGVTTTPAFSLNAGGAYLVVGGLTGIGREVVRWLAREGARYVIAISRRGPTDQPQQTQALAAELETRGCKLIPYACDIADSADLARFLDLARVMLPIRGVINAALALADAAWADMTLQQWKVPLAAKYSGSCNLLAAFAAEELDFFISLSSVTGVVGSHGQANYTAVSTFQDAQARWRVAATQKLPGVSIALGGVLGVGYIQQTAGVAERAARAGWPLHDIREVLWLIELAIRCPRAGQVIAGISQWTVDATAGQQTGASSSSPPAWRRERRFSALPVQNQGNNPAAIDRNEDMDDSVSLGERLLAAESDEARLTMLVDALRHRLADMFVLAPSAIDMAQPLAALGVDSLVAVELRNWLAASGLRYNADTVSIASVYIYDIYKGYFNNKASGKQLVRMSHFAVAIWSLLMAVIATEAKQARRNLAPILGSITSLTSWLGSAHTLHGEVTISSTSQVLPLLIGKVVSVLSGIIFSVAITYAFEEQALAETLSPEMDALLKRGTRKTILATIIFFAITFIWAWGTALVITFLPLWQSRPTLLLFVRTCFGFETIAAQEDMSIDWEMTEHGVQGLNGLRSPVLAAPHYAVPDAQPGSAVGINPAPVGASFEFFMWPSYMTNISLTLPCIDHFNMLYNRKMPIRIGGTTQDRATYDPAFKGYVSYSVNDPLEAPMSLTYGPKFFDLIRKFGSETILGFNRGLNNRTNTFAAVLKAKEKVAKYLWAIELGNEPDLYWKYWEYPVAEAPWNETQEGSNAADWAQDFINHWKSPLPILAGGGYAIPFAIEPDWPNLPYLIEHSYNKTVKEATKVYNGHLYAFSNASADDLGPEMKHQRVVQDLNLLPISSAKAAGRPYILGETGFHGLDYEMDSTFGSAIQTTDKTLRALTLGIQRLFYHQGTINQAFFNWWWSDHVNAPFYGAYFGALAVAGGDSIVASDDGTDPYAQYIVYKSGKAFKVVLINTDYYSGSGTRSETKFTLSGLRTNSVKALRMTGPSSETTVPITQTKSSPQPSIGGQSFSNKNCELSGKQNTEKFSVKKGKLEVSLKASEALIVYL
ncbi:hypothetical protein FPRO06_08946 [Fusarium proliferatum]|nr:hypothetical protein FPRO06_08946 [Fusarium proliferatum]